ncbi:hypothetical protein H8356DRAFT_1330814 [Neocallimastix lanati (nom. inval.)]|nr:hypothetical protein H8356DRAFT_1330814 [Neocallimastix sp. JGI-2020a]
MFSQTPYQDSLLKILMKFFELILDLDLPEVIYKDEDKKNIINRNHLIGHEGAKKTTNRIMQSYYWPGIWNDVKMPKPQVKDTENHTTPVEQPFTKVGLDIIEMKEVEEITINNLEEVEETDPSVVAQPSIMNNTEKLEREEEIIQDAETNNKKEEERRHSYYTNIPNRIILLHDDLTKLTANISIAQLLDIRPKLRSELTKALKLKSPELVEENPEKVMIGVTFLDTYTSINIITRSFLNKLKNVTPSDFSDNIL